MKLKLKRPEERDKILKANAEKNMKWEKGYFIVDISFFADFWEKCRRVIFGRKERTRIFNGQRTIETGGNQIFVKCQKIDRNRLINVISDRHVRSVRIYVVWVIFMNNNNNEVILKVRSWYRCCFDVVETYSKLKTRFNHLSFDGQTEFVDLILKDTISRDKYPIRKDYKTKMLKFYLDDVSKANEEVNEDLLSEFLLCSQINTTHTVLGLLGRLDEDENDKKIAFRSYELFGSDTIVPIKQKDEFNEVSETVWPAGMVLTEYFVNNKGEIFVRLK